MNADNDTLAASDYTPKLSVIIPLYNHEKFIDEAIHSVLEQSFSDFELIIINDGSTDRSEEVVQGIRDKRIRYFAQVNQGAHTAINRGIRLSRGDYVSILNSDDVYYRTRLEEALAVLETDTSVQAVFSHIELVDEGGNHIRFKRGAEDNWLNHNAETSFKERNDITLDLLAGNFLHTTSNLVCRRGVFECIGYFSNLRYIHDYEFFLRLCYNYKVHIIEQPLLKYRFHSSNALDEDYALANFETSLVLANFLIGYDLGDAFSSEDQKSALMAKFFNSLSTFDTDRIIMILFLFHMKNHAEGSLLEMSTGDRAEPFRKACLEYLRKFRDMFSLKQTLIWQEGQTEVWWREAEKLRNETGRLIEEIGNRDEECRRAREEIMQKNSIIRRLSEKEAILNSIISSLRWKCMVKLGATADRILPKGSKRRLWMKYIVGKITS